MLAVPLSFVTHRRHTYRQHIAISVEACRDNGQAGFDYYIYYYYPIILSTFVGRIFPVQHKVTSHVMYGT